MADKYEGQIEQRMEAERACPDFEEMVEAPFEKPLLPMAYFKFRLTLSADSVTQATTAFWTPSRLRRLAKPYVDKIITGYSANNDWTGAVEVLDKFGNFTRPHLHLHFASVHKKDTILTCIKRLYKAINDEVMKGVGVYALIIETHICEDRFYKYPLKQLHEAGLANNMTNLTNYPGQVLEAMRISAHDQWKFGCEVNNTKSARHETVLTRYERMCEYLLKSTPESPNEPTCLTEVIKGICLFYIKENAPMNMVTIKGYALQFCLKTGLMDLDVFVGNIERQCHT